MILPLLVFYFNSALHFILLITQLLVHTSPLLFLSFSWLLRINSCETSPANSFSQLLLSIIYYFPFTSGRLGCKLQDLCRRSFLRDGGLVSRKAPWSLIVGYPFLPVFTFLISSFFLLFSSMFYFDLFLYIALHFYFQKLFILRAEHLPNSSIFEQNS